MSRLSEEQYGRYMDLLSAWMEAERELSALDSPDAAAVERARAAYEAITAFREEHGLPTALAAQSNAVWSGPESPGERAWEAG